MSIQQENFKQIADKIREKTNTEDLIKPIDFVEKIDDVFEAGRKKEYDMFWDAFQNYGQPKAYPNAFSYNSWFDNNIDIYNPKYPFVIVSCNFMFGGNTKITDIKVPLDFTQFNVTQAYNIFEDCTKLETIPLLKLNNNQPSLKIFYNCKSLKNITFEGTIKKPLEIYHSTKLSRNSLLSLLQALTSVVSEVSIILPTNCIDGTTDTLTLIQNDNELNTAYINAIANGYLIGFN